MQYRSTRTIARFQSLSATFELKTAGTGTRLVMTEQGASLDGYDDAGSRERGSNFLLDALGPIVD